MEFPTNTAGKQEIIASGSNGRPLVARIWTGRTRVDVADEYLAYLYKEGVLTVEQKPGNLGMQLFRKIEGDVAEFTTISYWESFEAMKAMHEAEGDDGNGGDLRRVWHLEKDPDYLLELPEYAEITELHANDWQLSPTR